MASRRWRKLAILAKIETIYGTDAAPVAANRIVATNVNFTPIEGDEVSRDLLLPYLGNQGVVLAGIYGKISFDVEVAGGGAAGDVPQYGALLRACGMAETITAGTSVVYSIVEDAVEAASIYFESDLVRHVLLGSRGNVSVNFTPKGIPRFTFTMTGLLGTITDIATMSAVTAAGLVTPLPVSKANTQMTLHGWSAVAESLALDLGNTVTPRFLIGDELVLISNRSTTGTAVVEARSLATVDWFGRALNRTRGALALTHGSAAGNIVELDAPAVEIGKVTQGNTDNISNYSLPLSLCPTVGLDELTITVR